MNLSDLHWTSEGETSNLDPVADTLNNSPEEPVRSKVPAASVLQRFDFEQRESRKINEKLRKEKFLEKQERERLLSEVAADREARRLVCQISSLLDLTSGFSDVLNIWNLDPSQVT